MEAKEKTIDNKEVLIIATCQKEEALPTDTRTLDGRLQESFTI